MYRSLTPILSSFVFLATVGLYGQQPATSNLAKPQAKDEAKSQTVGKAKADEPAKDKEKGKISTDEEPVITHHSFVSTASSSPIRQRPR